MFRIILALLASLLAISVLRLIVGVITKGFSEMMRDEKPAEPQSTKQRPPTHLTGGDLHKCLECNAYHTALTFGGRTDSGETVYFCSTVCREKYVTSGKGAPAKIV